MSPLKAYRIYKAIQPVLATLEGGTVINWKTSLAAIIAVTPLVLKLFGHPLTAEEASVIQTIAVTFGFSYAKDNNVTGGDKKQ